MIHWTKRQRPFDQTEDLTFLDFTITLHPLLEISLCSDIYTYNTLDALFRVQLSFPESSTCIRTNVRGVAVRRE